MLDAVQTKDKKILFLYINTMLISITYENSPKIAEVVSNNVDEL